MDSSQIPGAARRVLNRIDQMHAFGFYKTIIEPHLPKEQEVQRACVAFENACVDSSMTAIRVMDDFFGPTGPTQVYPTDLRASHFSGFVSSYPGIDQLNRDKINRHIAHLTHLDLDAPGQSYGYQDCLRPLVAASIEFCDYLIGLAGLDEGVKRHAAEVRSTMHTIKGCYVDRP